VISVIVSCTERKSSAPPPSLQLRSLPPGHGSERVSEWVSRLSAASASLSAADLYRGEHWTVAQSIATSTCASVYVASAGYGLIRPSSKVTSYSATFTARGPDTVVTPASPTPDDDRRLWWNALSDWAGPDGSRPSIVSLVEGGPVVLAMSGAYAAALEDELAAAERRHPGKVTIVSCGGVPARLEHLRVPGDARLRHHLGGSLQALNARVAAELVRELGPDRLTRSAASSFLSRRLESSPRMPRWDRQTVSDSVVTSFIRSALDASPGLTCTRAHRRLRDGGIACEQRRFKALFQQVVSGR
jgi:hypothetical protein